LLVEFCAALASLALGSWSAVLGPEQREPLLGVLDPSGLFFGLGLLSFGGAPFCLGFLPEALFLVPQLWPGPWLFGTAYSFCAMANCLHCLKAWMSAGWSQPSTVDGAVMPEITRLFCRLWHRSDHKDFGPGIAWHETADRGSFLFHSACRPPNSCKQLLRVLRLLMFCIGERS